MLGLIFLAYAENRFEAVRREVEAKATARNPVTTADYKARSVLYVPDELASPTWSTCPRATTSARRSTTR